MIVGDIDKREVSELNNELFLSAKKLMEESTGNGVRPPHVGWAEVGDFIDWLEKNYEIKKKAFGWWNCQTHGRTPQRCACGAATAFVETQGDSKL
jgi:hypothetical protein